MKIFITAGIGDFLASECFFPEKLRQSLTKIYYATPQQNAIIELMKALPNYPNLKEQIIIWPEFNNPAPYCFFHKTHFEKYNQAHNGNPLPEDWTEVEDWSIAIRFKDQNDLTVYNFFELSKKLIKQEPFQDYTGSSFLKHKLCEIPQLPENAVIIAPGTNSFGTPPQRNFNNDDWKKTLELLVEKNQTGVVLGIGEFYVPRHSRILNLLNKTKITETIEIMKQCKGYYGVDSFMSVLAAKLYENENIRIKSLNSHCYRYKEIYYYPKKTFEFIYGIDPVVLHANNLV